jgi:hypothetical protein
MFAKVAIEFGICIRTHKIIRGRTKKDDHAKL